MVLPTPELDLANTLLDCLRGALADHSSPPAQVCLRVGEEVRQDLSIYEDECCAGLAYVKINTVYPSATFPEPLEDPTNCVTGDYAVELEMGIFRCAPVGDQNYTATCEAWTNTATLVGMDLAAMRRAVVCFRGTLVPGDYLLVRPWIPLGPNGNCTGGTMPVVVSFTC